jgi:hypothetical protein
MKTTRKRSLLTVFGFVVLCLAGLSAIGLRGLLPGGSAEAQVGTPVPTLILPQPQTWVSGTGNDESRRCSRIEPCKSFRKAIATTQAGGIVSVLDPGNFILSVSEPTVIDRSITIDGGGSEGTLVNAAGSGFEIRAQSFDRVILRNLSIQNVAPPGNAGGINIFGGGTVTIENVRITGFLNGIATTVSQGNLYVNDSLIHSNSNAGVLCNTGQCTLENVRMENNGSGLREFSNLTGTTTVVTMRRYLIAGSPNLGIFVNPGRLVMEDCMVTDNRVGISGGGITTTMLLSRNTIVNNDEGLQRFNGANLVSFGDNKLGLNTSDGASFNGFIAPR